MPAARIQALAEAFAKAKAPLAIGGNGAAAHTNGSFSLQAILMLNYLVGAVGRRGGVLLNPAGSVREFTDLISADPLRAWRNLADRMRNGEVNILMVHNANPLYGLPPSVQFGQALAKVPVIVSFSSFMDETTAMADLILPDSSYLESWDAYMAEPGVGYEAVAFQQPVVLPVYSTRAFGDTLLAASKALGEDMKPGLAWESMKDALKALSQPMHQANRGSIRATESGKPVSYDTWWNRVLAAGGFWDERATRQGALPTGKAFPAQAVEAKFSGDEKSYPFNLVLFPGAGIADGSMAHLPWLQATPDPMTTVAWQTWIELNPKDAEEMRLRTGDIVRVDSAKGSLETVVYVYPAIAPGTVAMPTGQGHNYLGRYAEKRGANPLTIVDPELIDPATGALAFNATRVKLSKTGRRYNLPRIEGGGLKKVEQPDDYAVVQVTDGKGGGESHAAGGH